MFEVRWNRLATGQLATIWIDSSDRNAITDASFPSTDPFETNQAIKVNLAMT